MAEMSNWADQTVGFADPGISQDTAPAEVPAHFDAAGKGFDKLVENVSAGAEYWEAANFGGPELQRALADVVEALSAASDAWEQASQIAEEHAAAMEQLPDFTKA